jgi:hypothetical protein
MTLALDATSIPCSPARVSSSAQLRSDSSSWKRTWAPLPPGSRGRRRAAAQGAGRRRLRERIIPHLGAARHRPFRRPPASGSGSCIGCSGDHVQAANCSAGRAHGTAVTPAHREKLIATTLAADVLFQLNDITNKARPGDPGTVSRPPSGHDNRPPGRWPAVERAPRESSALTDGRRADRRRSVVRSLQPPSTAKSAQTIGLRPWIARLTVPVTAETIPALSNGRRV